MRDRSHTATIIGQRLDGVGHFQQRFPASGSYFPSIVDIPSAGCWRLTVNSGRRSARFAFLALAP